MGFLSFDVPKNDPKMHNQTEQSEISDEEFKHMFDAPRPNIFQKLLRLITFIIFLGPIRYVLAFFFLFTYFINVSIIAHFERFFKTKNDFKKWAFKFLTPNARLVMFCFGICKIKVNGSIDPEARALICNHTTMLDMVCLLNMMPLSFVGMASLKNSAFIKCAAKIYDIVYVDRAEQGSHASQTIVDAINDPTILPVMIFPEGKVTSGDHLLGFRTGAFLTDATIQPVTLRYHQWLIPKGTTTISWLENTFFHYLYQVVATPFFTVDLDFLPPLNWKGKSTTPSQRAVEAQLIMANHIGVPALKRTNKDFFMKPKTD